MTTKELLKKFKAMVDEKQSQIWLNYINSPRGLTAAHIKEMKDYAFSHGYSVDHEEPYTNYPQETFIYNK